MKINKVASSKSEMDLFNILNKRSIKKTAMIGGILRLLVSGAKYTAGGAAAKYAYDTASEYMSGDLSSLDLDDMLFGDKEIFRAYSRLKVVHDNEAELGKICALWKVIEKGVSTTIGDPSSSEKTSPSEPKLDLESLNKSLSKYSSKSSTILKMSEDGSDCPTVERLKQIILFELDVAIYNFKAASSNLEIAKAEAESQSGTIASAMGTLGSGYEWAKGAASQLFQTDFLPDSPDQAEALETAKKNLEDATDEYSKYYTILIKDLTDCIENCKKIIKLYESKKSAIKAMENNSSIKEEYADAIGSTEKLISLCTNFISTIDKKMSSYHKSSAKAAEMSAMVKKHEDNYFIPSTIKFEDKRFSAKYSPIIFENMHLRTKDQSVLRIDALNIEMPKIYSGSSWINSYTDEVKKRVQKIITNELLFVKHLTFFRRSNLGSTTKEQDNFFRYLSEMGFVNQIIESYRRIIYNIITSDSISYFKLKQNIGLEKGVYDVQYGSENKKDRLDFMTTAHNYKYLLAMIYDVIYVSEDIGSSGMMAKIQSAFSLMLEKYISEDWIPSDVKSMKARRKIRKRHQKLDRRQQKTREKYRDDAYLFADDMEVSAKNQQNNLEKHSHSINKNDSIVKNSNFLDQYYKDAISGLSNPDPLLKEFYQSMRQETLRNSELRDARKNLRGSEEQEGQDIVNQAHPKEIRLSDAHGDGGLLENGNEQKERSLQVAKKNPTGNFK